jgi:hypothetical protein
MLPLRGDIGQSPCAAANLPSLALLLPTPSEIRIRVHTRKEQSLVAADSPLSGLTGPQTTKLSHPAGILSVYSG